MAAQNCFPSCRLQAPNGTVAITLPLHGGNRRAGLRACRRRSAPRPSKRALMRWSRSRQQQWHRGLASSWRRRSGGRRRRGRRGSTSASSASRAWKMRLQSPKRAHTCPSRKWRRETLLSQQGRGRCPRRPTTRPTISPLQRGQPRCVARALSSLSRRSHQHTATSTLPFTPTHPHTIRMSLPTTTTTTPPLPAGAPPRPLRPPQH